VLLALLTFLAMIAGTLNQGDLVAPFDYNTIHLSLFNLGPSRRHCLCPLPFGLAQAGGNLFADLGMTLVAAYGSYSVAVVVGCSQLP